MLEFSESQVIAYVGQYLWPLTRISAFMLAAPIFGTQVVSAKIRLVLAVMITVLVAPLIPDIPAFDGLSLNMLVTSLQQVLIGIALAFVFQVVFQLFVLSGQFIAMKMGLGFASMNDPANGVSVTIVSQFYLLVTTLLFLSVNGHLMLLQVIIDSFTVLPIGEQGLDRSDFFEITTLGSWMFVSALTLSLPILTALLIVNIAFGVMSRAAPQINIFAVGFPITLIFGLLLMWLGFSDFLPLFQDFVGQGFVFTQKLMEP